MSKLASLAAVLKPEVTDEETPKVAPVLSSKEDKFAQLKAIEKLLNKKFETTNSVVKLGDKPTVNIESIPTNMPSVDFEVLGCGGVPRGRIVEIYGPESCLEEDTFIQYTVWDKITGKRINHKGGKLKHLYERFHGKFTKGCGHHLAKNDVYFTAPSINDDNRIIHNRIVDVIDTGKKSCFKITLNDGTTIEATEDHKFFGQGIFIPTKELKIGTILHIHNNTPFTCEYPPREYRKEFLVKYHPDAPLKVIDGKYKYYRLRKTRAVFEASLNGISLDDYIQKLNNFEKDLKYISSYMHVHHIDENVQNDSLDNLVLISPENHGKLHAHQRHNNLRFVAIERSVTKIDNVGLKNTFDIKMESPFNNYVANKFVVHNSGKTTLCLHIVAEEQKNTDNLCAYIDAEHSIDIKYAEKLGVNTKELIFAQPDSGEQALETALELIESKTVSLIVIDSVAALVPQAELDGEMGDSHMGLQARLMSQAMRKMRGIAAQNGVTIIFINQIREKIGVMFGSPETTSGGRALKFFASVRLDVRRKTVIKEGSGDNAEIIGHKLQIKGVKNKVGSPMREVLVDLIYGKGFDKGADWVEYGVQSEVIEKSGAWYAFNGERLGQGLTSAGNCVTLNPELMIQIKQKITEKQSEEK